MRILRRLTLAVLLAGALLAFAYRSFGPLFWPSGPNAHRSTKAPGWKLKDTDGKPVQSSDFAGKVVILNFWATWCAPCKAETPGFVELQRKYGEKGLIVIGISLDEYRVSKVRQFVEEFGINYPIAMGSIEMLKGFGGPGVPSTFVIDRTGHIVARHTGFTSKKTFEKEIRPLF
jgi:peroxiredoxin